jgi:hypothetical protein
VIPDDQPPVHKLVYAFLLTAIKKQVRFFAIVPDAIWFGTETSWNAEIRPPLKLHTALVDRVAEMLGVDAPWDPGEWIAGPLVLELEAIREPFAIRIERISEGWWVLGERLNDIEHEKRVRSGVLVQPVVPPIPIPGQRMEGNYVAFDPVRREPTEYDPAMNELEDE